MVWVSKENIKVLKFQMQVKSRQNNQLFEPSNKWKFMEIKTKNIWSDLFSTCFWTCFEIVVSSVCLINLTRIWYIANRYTLDCLTVYYRKLQASFNWYWKKIFLKLALLDAKASLCSTPVSQLVRPGTHYLQLGHRGAFASPQSRIGLFPLWPWFISDF